jgi:broad specificity phosphatase PhoE
MMGGVTLVYLVQHGEKEPRPGDPGLTGTGRKQAIHTGRRLHGVGISALYSSPMRRARETAEGIASVTGLTVRLDTRLRERLNWDGSLPFEAFLDLWAKTMRDHDWIPADGESSRQAGWHRGALRLSGTTTVSHRRGQNHDNVTSSWLRPQGKRCWSD